MDRDERDEAERRLTLSVERDAKPPLSLRQIDRSGALSILERRSPPGRLWAAGYPTDGDIEAARLFIRRLGEGEEQGPFGIFEILEGEADEVVGGIGFYRPPGAEGAVEVGYGIVSSRWNQGICTDALRTIVAFARDNGASRVEARSLPNNIASRRVMEKVGLEFVDVVDGFTRYEIRFI